MDNNGMNYDYENNYNSHEMNYNSLNNYGVQKTNTLAIVGFILTFVPIISLIGWILCIVALFQIKITGEKGKGLAIAGIVWPLVVVVLFVALICFVFLFVWPSIEQNVIETTVCNHGPNVNISEGENSIVCNSEYNGQYKCVYTINGKSGSITCNMNE